MAKARAQKEAKSAKIHLKARLDFLRRAAEYLHNTAIGSDRAKNAIADSGSDINTGTSTEERTTQATDICDDLKTTTATRSQRTTKKPLTNLARMSISQMRGVSLKTQMRLPVPVKRSYCKKCDTLLTPGVSSEHEIKNSSRGRKKPWADMLVVSCLVCGTEKRFPQTERRSRKLQERQAYAKRQADGEAT